MIPNRSDYQKKGFTPAKRAKTFGTAAVARTRAKLSNDSTLQRPSIVPDTNNRD